MQLLRGFSHYSNCYAAYITLRRVLWHSFCALTTQARICIYFCAVCPSFTERKKKIAESFSLRIRTLSAKFQLKTTTLTTERIVAFIVSASVCYADTFFCFWKRCTFSSSCKKASRRNFRSTWCWYWCEYFNLYICIMYIYTFVCVCA